MHNVILFTFTKLIWLKIPLCAFNYFNMFKHNLSMKEYNALNVSDLEYLISDVLLKLHVTICQIVLLHLRIVLNLN